MATVLVKNLRDHEVSFHEICIEGTRVWTGRELIVAAGETVEVSDVTALGAPAFGIGGLIAGQEENWELADKAKRTTKTDENGAPDA